ncbi:predicted protein [Sclerotinia sclerotiorum 1980 UF-70]|uniref:Uncharacterized protein n=1 Tax=Sclerotinia sclerotiorum (strain ATCC 18683 / 1980 / Ss-1) TaxID=665079 RepID=A7EYR5_SCLS1|nr:predicted protein [Sclerotinia sclerotiorum 1980 UF-70]EDN94607.1 predicted protein [Sclerotinia sclerotiorum 1980 UF-70]
MHWRFTTANEVLVKKRKGLAIATPPKFTTQIQLQTISEENSKVVQGPKNQYIANEPVERLSPLFANRKLFLISFNFANQIIYPRENDVKAA